MGRLLKFDKSFKPQKNDIIFRRRKPGMDNLKNIIDREFQEAGSMIDFHIFNEILPMCCVSEKDFTRTESVGEFKYFDNFKLNDDRVEFRSSQMNQVKDSIFND